MSAVSHNLESISAHHNTDDVSTQHKQMVSDSREYTYNDVGRKIICSDIITMCAVIVSPH